MSNPKADRFARVIAAGPPGSVAAQRALKADPRMVSVPAGELEEAYRWAHQGWEATGRRHGDGSLSADYLAWRDRFRVMLANPAQPPQASEVREAVARLRARADRWSDTDYLGDDRMEIDEAVELAADLRLVLAAAPAQPSQATDVREAVQRVSARASSLERIGADRDAADLRTILAALPVQASDGEPVAWRYAHPDTPNDWRVTDHDIGQDWPSLIVQPLYASPVSPDLPVAHLGALVPPHCTGTSLSFEPGVLHVSKDGSGYIAINQDDFSLEDDRCEGPDGPEGSVHWITRMEASEMIALRDFLNGVVAPAFSPDLEAEKARLREALEPFAALARTRYPEEGGAPSWIDLMTCNGEQDEIELRSHTAAHGRTHVIDGDAFRNALAALEGSGR